MITEEPKELRNSSSIKFVSTMPPKRPSDKEKFLAETNIQELGV
jgi:hypothetical protein